jgi:hypothetical protein
MDTSEIRRICSGRRAQTIKPLGLGEVAIRADEEQGARVVGSERGIADEVEWRGSVQSSVSCKYPSSRSRRRRIGSKASFKGYQGV